MTDYQLAARLDRLEATMKEMHVTLVRLEWRLEAAGIFPGNVSYGSDAQRFALENNFPLERGMEHDPTTDADLSRVLDWLGAHEDDPKANFMDLETAFPELKPRLKRILQFLHIRKQYESTIRRLAEGFGGSKWIATDPYAGERK